MRNLLVACCLGPVLVTGCLPGDTRPPPGSVYVKAAPSDATVHGTTTPDGWTIVFDRLLVGLGNVSVHGTDCLQYTDARYSRLYDFAAAGGREQKLGLAFGLGTCAVWVHVRAPESDAVLMQGATPADVQIMRVSGFDDYAVAYADWDGPGQRISVLVRGRATRGDIEKRFEWAFRQRFAVKTCPPGPDGGSGNIVELRAETQANLNVVFHGEELFRSAADDEADLWFDPFAEADADGDGNVTFDELAELPAPSPAEEGEEAESFAHFVYRMLLPRTVRMGGSEACEVELRRGG